MVMDEDRPFWQKMMCTGSWDRPLQTMVLEVVGNGMFRILNERTGGFSRCGCVWRLVRGG